MTDTVLLVSVCQQPSPNINELNFSTKNSSNKAFGVLLIILLSSHGKRWILLINPKKGAENGKMQL